MSQSDRANEFKAEVERCLGKGACVAGPMLGLSNRARISSDHLFAGGPNLVNFMGGTALEDYDHKHWTSFGLTSCISPLIGIELHVGLALASSTEAFRQKLREFIEARQKAGETPGHNNTLVGLSGNGELLLGIGKDDDLRATGIKPDRFFVGVYPGDSRTRLNPAVQEFIGSVQELIGEDKVHRVDLWSDSSVSDGMRRMPSDIGLDTLVKRITGTLGGCHAPELLRRFHNGLNFHPRKHFVILSGVSGTGKSSLAQRYAYAVHGLESLADNDPLFFWCRVRPDWTDPSGLLGHFDVFSNKFVVPPFLDALLTADAYPSSPVFVCLDEMNLARIEYYLADVLSAMETPHARLQLHTNAQAYEGDSGIRVPKSIKWPTNLYLVGTINIDETTTLPSPKVLDRAVVIDMSNIDVEAVIKDLVAKNSEFKPVADRCGGTIAALLKILRQYQLAFGYRAVEELLRYVAFADEDHKAATIDTHFDEQVSQKVLSKLRGTHEQADMISQLKTLIKEYPLCKETVDRMEQELGEMGSFQAMR